MVVVLVVGTAIVLLRVERLTTRSVLGAVLSGLFGLFVFQLTVGSVWGYAVEYHNAGGEWTDLPFLTPFVAAGLAGVVVGVRSGSVGVAAWTAFWAFIVVAALVAVVAWIAAGYRGAEA
jgi:hypothetical protein